MSDYMLICCPRALDGKLSEAMGLAVEGGGIFTKSMKSRTAFKQGRLENK